MPTRKQSPSTGSQGGRSAGTGAGGGSEVSGGQASYILGRLLKDRRITQAEVSRYISEMGREISELERRLAELREAHGGKIAAVAAAAVAGAAAVTMVRRRPGRPAGSGRKPGRPAGTGTGRRPGRPAASGAGTGSSTGAGASGGTDAGTGTATAGTGGAKGAKRGRKASAALTAGQLASRQLQGRYLSLVRQFPENKRAAFARTAKEKGREAAIKEMQDSLKK